MRNIKLNRSLVTSLILFIVVASGCKDYDREFWDYMWDAEFAEKTLKDFDEAVEYYSKSMDVIDKTKHQEVCYTALCERILNSNLPSPSKNSLLNNAERIIPRLNQEDFFKEQGRTPQKYFNEEIRYCYVEYDSIRKVLNYNSFYKARTAVSNDAFIKGKIFVLFSNIAESNCYTIDCVPDELFTRSTDEIQSIILVGPRKTKRIRDIGGDVSYSNGQAAFSVTRKVPLIDVKRNIIFDSKEFVSSPPSTIIKGNRNAIPPGFQNQEYTESGNKIYAADPIEHINTYIKEIGSFEFRK